MKKTSLFILLNLMVINVIGQQIFSPNTAPALASLDNESGIEVLNSEGTTPGNEFLLKELIFSLSTSLSGETATIQFKPGFSTVRLFIYDKDGNRIMKRRIRSSSVVLDLKPLKSSTYFICAKAGEFVQSKKLVKH